MFEKQKYIKQNYIISTSFLLELLITTPLSFMSSNILQVDKHLHTMATFLIVCTMRKDAYLFILTGNFN